MVEENAVAVHHLAVVAQQRHERIPGEVQAVERIEECADALVTVTDFAVVQADDVFRVGNVAVEAVEPRFAPHLAERMPLHAFQRPVAGVARVARVE